MKEVNEIAFEITKTINNIKNHDFSVADYKLCKNEADYVLEALDMYLSSIRFESIKTIGQMNDNTEPWEDNLVDAINTMEMPT